MKNAPSQFRFLGVAPQKTTSQFPLASLRVPLRAGPERRMLREVVGRTEPVPRGASSLPSARPQGMGHVLSGSEEARRYLRLVVRAAAGLHEGRDWRPWLEAARAQALCEGRALAERQSTSGERRPA